MPNMSKVHKLWGFEKKTQIGETSPKSGVDCLFDYAGIDCDQIQGPGCSNFFLKSPSSRFSAASPKITFFFIIFFF